MTDVRDHEEGNNEPRRIEPYSEEWVRRMIARGPKKDPEYLPPPECSVCDDVGWLPSPDGHYPCRCTVEANRRARLRRMGLRDADQRHTLDAYEPDRHASAAAALGVSEDYHERWPDYRAAGRGLYIHGADPGTGKTHLSEALLMAIEERFGVDALYAPSAMFMRRASDFGGDRNPNDLVDGAVRVELLVLDDVDKVGQSDYQLRTIWEIVDSRCAAGLPSIITANRSIDELGDWVGGKHGRYLSSRLHGACAEVHLWGPDQRRRSAAGKGD